MPIGDSNDHLRIPAAEDQRPYETPPPPGIAIEPRVQNAPQALASEHAAEPHAPEESAFRPAAPPDGARLGFGGWGRP